MIISCILMKCKESFSFFVKLSLIFTSPPIWRTVINSEDIYSLIAFSLIVICSMPFIVVGFDQYTQAVLSLYSLMGSFLYRYIWSTVMSWRMWLRRRSSFTHFSDALTSTLALILVVPFCCLATHISGILWYTMKPIIDWTMNCGTDLAVVGSGNDWSKGS